MESNVQVENEKSYLMYQVHKLEGTVQQLEEKLSDSAMMCGAIKQKYEQERQTGLSHMQQLEEELSETCRNSEEITEERDRELEAPNTLEMQNEMNGL
ncbi:hypothetical protein Q7C36_016067 [Tachysurus vachellii]|uniref:Uncharacterized protein n=1 Tax=Tachysurus vachellii TaxID=175792 RepID=A0AA88M8F1_TACVA|nr:hypothetical protein Q7C36_016067 [Tachysurus vachellii]